MGIPVVDRKDDVVIKPILKVPTALRVIIVPSKVQLEQWQLLQGLVPVILVSLSLCRCCISEWIALGCNMGTQWN